MKVDGRLLRRLTWIVAALSLAWPAGTGTPVEPTPTCPPGSGVGIDDFVIWVDGTGGNADIPVRSALPCAATRTIYFKTYDITARSGTDYVGVTSGTVTLTGGTNYTTIRIRILSKQVPGPDVTFGVQLTSGANFTDADGTVTIKSRY